MVVNWSFLLLLSGLILQRYLSQQHVLVLYGRLTEDYYDCNPEFIFDSSVAVVIVKPVTKQALKKNILCIFLLLCPIK
ncbi:hypothetical protein Hanom_Chr04g00342511 [Helianthus anomalus]